MQIVDTYNNLLFDCYFCLLVALAFTLNPDPARHNVGFDLNKNVGHNNNLPLTLLLSSANSLSIHVAGPSLRI